MAILGAPAHAIYINDRAAAELGFGNIWDRNNRFSATVAITLNDGKFCTGTLIDPRTVLTASHCLASDETEVEIDVRNFQIRFGPNASITTPHDRAVGGALIHPGYDSGIFAKQDIALISLAEPVTGIEPVALALDPQQLPSFGDLVVIAGYGVAGLPATEHDVDFFRRVAKMNFAGIYPVNSSPAIHAPFRNPHDPSYLDHFGLAEAGIEVPYLQGSAAPGDSGGPMYYYSDGRFWQIGTVIGGIEAPPPHYDARVPDYGIVNIYTPVAAYADWLQAEKSYRVVTLAAGDRTWSAADGWVDGLGRHETPSNVAGSFAERGSLGRFYGVRLTQPGTVTLDIDPTIDDLLVGNAETELAIGKDRRLSVVAGTVLQEGSLRLSGRLETGTLIASGGTVFGSGTLASPSGVANIGATFVSGGDGSTEGLRIEGHYVQGPDGILVVPIDDAAKTFTVTGAAALDGLLYLSPASELINIGDSYQVLTAGGLAGRFASAVSDFDFISPAIAYSGTDVSASFQRNSLAFADLAEDENQTSVATALESIDRNDALYRGILNSRAGTASTVLASLSAQPYANAGVSLLRQSVTMRENTSRKRDRVQALPTDKSSDSHDATRPKSWAMVQALSGELEAGSAATTTNHSGVAVFSGLGMQGSKWEAGLLFGYSDASIGMHAPVASASVQSFHLGAEGSLESSGFVFSVGGMHSWHETSMSRALSVPGLPSSATAEFSSQTIQAYGEVAYPVAVTDRNSVTPFARVTWAEHRIHGFLEQGGPASLSVAPSAFDDTTLALGLRAEGTLHSSDDLTLTARAGFALHNGLGAFSPVVTASFHESDEFHSSGLDAGRNTAAFNGGLDLRFGNASNLSIDYVGEFGTGRSDHALKLRLDIPL